MARLHMNLPGPFSVSFGGRRRYSSSGGGGGGFLLLCLGVLLLLSVAIYVVGAVVAWWLGCALVGGVWWLIRYGKSRRPHEPWPIPLNVQFWPLKFTPKVTAPPMIAPPGWYTDPEYGEGLRWWDGWKWTADTQPALDRQ